MLYRKFITTFTCILTAAVYFIFVRPDLDSSDHLPFSADTPVEELISQTMAIDEKAVGRFVDRNVILKDVYRSPPLQLNYVFTVVRVTDYFKRSDWRERTEQAIVSSACEVQRIRRILHRGGTVRYQYLDREGISLDTITIDPHTCSLA